MQTLLDDIELDIQELKCLMQNIAAEPDSKLRIVAKRSIQQMRMRLDELQKRLESGENRIEERMEVQEEEQKEDKNHTKQRPLFLPRLLFWRSG